MPFVRLEDICVAVSSLQTLREVHAECVGALGRSVGRGYIPDVAATDLRIEAVAPVGRDAQVLARAERTNHPVR
ncbi:hypothetical protein ABQE45_24100 [Mycobacteroides chelonae]